MNYYNIGFDITLVHNIDGQNNLSLLSEWSTWLQDAFEKFNSNYTHAQLIQITKSDNNLCGLRLKDLFAIASQVFFRRLSYVPLLKNECAALFPADSSLQPW